MVKNVIKGSFPMSKVLVFEGNSMLRKMKIFEGNSYICCKNEDIRLFYDCTY